jgi:transposase InsO family protein
MLKIKTMDRSTFYYSLHYKADKWEIERQRIVEIYYENHGRYGYRRIQKAMQIEGYVISGKSVRKLMKEAGIKCEVRMKKYKSYKGQVGRIAPNLLKRDFTADRPYEKLVTDVTEFSIFGTKLYLSPVLDLYNGELIYYTIYSRPVLEMVTKMIEGTIAVIGNKTNAILHSDQGWQYQHKEYQMLLKKNHLRQSMSRKGNCLDNAVMENFFGLLKSELLYLQNFDSLEHFKEELEQYLQYYNNDRIKLKLDGKSPVQYRTQTNNSYC